MDRIEPSEDANDKMRYLFAARRRLSAGRGRDALGCSKA